MEGMRWDDPVNKNHAEVHEVFDGMHRQARPGIHIDVLVVEVVNMFIERLPVDEPMRPVEVKLAPKRNGKQPHDEPDRMSMPR